MRLSGWFWLGLALLSLTVTAQASDWTEYQSRIGTFDETSPEQICEADFVVGSIPYHNSTTLVGAGNDCAVRGSEDHIYEIYITVPGTYSFSTCATTAQTNTRIYLKVECCTGPSIATSDNNCGFNSVLSKIDCAELTVGTYYLLIETQDTGGAGSYVLDIYPCTNACEEAWRLDGVYPNDDGSVTYYQTTDESDDSPLYGGPFPAGANPCVDGQPEFGFDIYSWYDQDYGWKHIFPDHDLPGLCIQSVQILICAWDIDQADCSNEHPNRPDSCELDHVFADGSLLNPNYLQGVDGEWSVTVFDVPAAAILDDGELNMFLDIDVWNTTCTWATAVNWAQLKIRYRTDNCTQPPYTPLVDGPECILDTQEVCVEVTGPVPPDPDGDAVTYSYRWFVQNAFTNGGYVDDELNPLHPVDHSGACIPAGDTEIDDLWLVEVYAVDAYGTRSLEPAVLSFLAVTRGPCGPQVPSGFDLGDLPSGDCEEGGYPVGSELNGGPANAVYALGVAWLGTTVTPEEEPNIPDADDGDDGVTFLNPPWMPCYEACVQIRVTTGPAYTGQPMYVYGWKDGDLDCSFSDVFCDGTASECIIPGAPIIGMEANQSQVFEFCFTDPGVLDFGRYDGLVRFRLMSTQPGCAAAQSGVDEVLGEVEDYVITDLQLDVNLLSFTAVQDGETVMLNWSTASEQDNDHFVIERGSGGQWQSVASIAGNGTSIETNHYSWRDRQVRVGSSYQYRLIAVDAYGNRLQVGEGSVVMGLAAPATITEYRLYTNYPNPFNPSTILTFDLVEAGHVKLSVYDVLGRQVELLVDESMPAGRHSVVFDAAGLPSGLYLYRIEAGAFSDMRKMVLMK